MPESEVTKRQLHEARLPSTGPAPLYLQLTYMYAPAWGYGGPVRLLFDYARWMSQECDVVVFTSDAHHDFTRIAAKTETISGVPIERHRLLIPTLAKRGFYLASPLMCVRAAQRIRASRGPAIVHFSGLRGTVTLYGLMLKLLFGTRVTLVHSAFGSLHYKRAWRRKIYDALFMRTFVKQVDLRLVQNEHEQDTYRQFCRDYGQENESKIVLLPLHVDTVPANSARLNESGKNPSEVREVRRAYGIPENAIVFLFLGRLHPAKGILRMIDAYLEFSASCSRESLLLIVGRDDGFQGKTEEYILRHQIQDTVRIVNNVYENRFDYYFLADVFLGFPTIFEETMLASIEAMACATPIIVSEEASIPFVKEEQAGLVIDFDVPTAAEAMAAITADLASFQANTRSVVSRHFSGAAVSRKLTALFRMILSGNLAGESPSEMEALEQKCATEESSLENSSSVASGE